MRFFYLLLLAGAGLSGFAQSTMHIIAGTGVNLANGVTVNLNNTNLIVDGTLQQTPGTGTFIFSGNAASSISGAFAPVFDSLTLAKGTGSKLSLQQSVSILSQVKFSSGLLDLNNNNLNLGITGLLVNESDSSRIIGPAGGQAIATATLNAPSGVNPGNLGAVITSAQNMGLTTIRRGHQSQAVGSGTGISVLRYFDILPANDVNLNAGLQFQYFDAELNGIDPDSLVLWSSADSVSWTNGGLTTRDTTAHYVMLAGIPAFSLWTLSSGTGNPLPLAYLYFNANCTSGEVRLQWATAQEVNTRVFDVERSGGDGQWKVIGSVAAAGNSAVETDYSFIDKAPLPGNDEYRIAEYDLNNSVTYTQVISDPCTTGEPITIWPNPVAGTLWLNIVTPEAANAMVRVYDNRGTLVLEKETGLPAGNNQVSVNMGDLARGSYEVRVDWGIGHHAAVVILKL
jgi:hypothetical protein